jgi:fibronectin type 3 domain-containing protein
LEQAQLTSFFSGTLGYSPPQLVSYSNYEYEQTVYIRVTGSIGGAAGTYAIRVQDALAVPPYPGTISRAEGFPFGIEIEWSEDLPEFKNGYRVYRSTSETGDYTQTGSDLSSNARSYVDTSASPGVTYWYKVASFNAAGEGPKSSPVSATAVNPAAVLPLSAGEWKPETSIGKDGKWYQFTASGGTYAIQWDESSGGSGTYVAYINVSAYRSDGTSFFTREYYGYSTPRTITGYTGTVYLKVESGLGYGNLYAIRYYDSSALAPEGAVMNPAAFATPAGIIVNWNQHGGADGYRVYRSPSGSGDYAQISSDLSGAVLGYTDTAVSEGLTYYYKVAAFNANGEGEKSQPVSRQALTLAPIPELTANVWQEETIDYEHHPYGSQNEYWYQFQAEGGTYAIEIGSPVEERDSYIRGNAYKSNRENLLDLFYHPGSAETRTFSGYTGTVYLRMSIDRSSRFAIRYRPR